MWLDDNRKAPEGWLWVKSVDEAIQYCTVFGFDEIEEMSLDHDLGKDAPTGYDFVKWMETQASMNNEDIPLMIFSHSMNPVGRKNIENAVEAIYKQMGLL